MTCREPLSFEEHYSASIVSFYNRLSDLQVESYRLVDSLSGAAIRVSRDEPGSVDRPPRQRKRRRQAEEPVQDRCLDPWFHTVTVLTRTQQAKMMKMARVIAGSEARLEWQTFLASWRTDELVPCTARIESPSSLASQPQEVQDFCYLYRQVAANEVASGFTTISHRIHLTKLWQQYLTIDEAVNRAPAAPRSKGQTKQAIRKRYLFNLLHPEFQALQDVRQASTSKQAWLSFTRQLDYASRWHLLKERLGLGVLALIPTRVVSNAWIQHELRLNELEIWIQAIHHFNPGCIAVGRQWADALVQVAARRPPRIVEGVSSSSRVLEQLFELEQGASSTLGSDFRLTVDDLNRMHDVCTRYLGVEDELCKGVEEDKDSKLVEIV